MFLRDITYLFQKPYTKKKVIDGVGFFTLGTLWIYSLNKTKNNK